VAGFKHFPSVTEAQVFYLYGSKPASGSYKCGDEQNYTKLFTEIQIYFVWCSSVNIRFLCLFGIDEFDIQRTVHRDILLK